MPKRKQTVVAVALALTGRTALAQFDAEFNLVDLDGTNGFTINGVNAYDRSGRSVSSAGDINGDGIDDLIIGATGAGPNINSNAGRSYVVFGNDGGFSNQLNLVDLNGSQGFTINGVNARDSSGISVSSAGDVNGDGIDDVVIGAVGTSSNGNSYAGSSYVVFGSDAGFSSSLDLENLDGSNGFTINGENAYDFIGRSVSSAGDVNGDGIDDLIIGATGVDPNGNSRAGSSYVVFGNDTGFSNPFNVANLDGIIGFTINGVNATDFSGYSVSSAGDVNGDGIDDVIIGAPYADPNGNSYAGSSYVVFGSDAGFPNPLDLSNLNGSNGFTINGVNASDFSGYSVSGAGDVNGDGIDDLIIGAYRADPNGNSRAGSSYVVFGSNTGLPNPLILSNLDGSNGFTINGESQFDLSGFSVNSAGDVNGDGIDDLIIGAKYVDPNGNGEAGSSYVVFGSEAGFPNPINLSELDGSNGFIINGINSGDRSGVSVSHAGDVNGDGIDDLIIGAPYAYPNGNSFAGSSYVVFGREKPIFKDGFE